MSKKDQNDTATTGKWEKFAQEQVEVDSVADADADADADAEEESQQQGADEALENNDQVADEVDLDQDDLETSVNRDDESFAAVEELQNEIQSLKLKMATYQDQAIRAAAEMENMQRRTERDVSHAHRFANEKIIKELLPVIDSLVRAQEDLDESDPAAKLIGEGVALTADLLEKTLVKFGLEVINPELGTAFNPELHEAMSMLPDPDANKNSVLQVLQKGYQLNGRVIRAAMVIVAS